MIKVIETIAEDAEEPVVIWATINVQQNDNE